jgi:hypothetical protein
VAAAASSARKTTSVRTTAKPRSRTASRTKEGGTASRSGQDRATTKNGTAARPEAAKGRNGRPGTVKQMVVAAKSAVRSATAAGANSLGESMQHSTSGDGDFLSGLVGGRQRNNR